MKIISVKEQEDGSAIVEADMTKEEISLILEVGFNKMITDGMENFENVFESRRDREGE